MGAREVFSFWVDGVPVPQGSKTVYMVKGRPILADANSAALKPWRKKVAAEAYAAYSGPQLVGAVAVELRFFMARGKTVKREYPLTKPDIDKLERAIFDGITDSGAWKDDAQVCNVNKSKRYGVPGVRVRVGLLEETGS